MNEKSWIKALSILNNQHSLNVYPVPDSLSSYLAIWIVYSPYINIFIFKRAFFFV